MTQPMKRKPAKVKAWLVYDTEADDIRWQREGYMGYTGLFDDPYFAKAQHAANANHVALPCTITYTPPPSARTKKVKR